MGEGSPVGREVGSTWLVVSGPPGSKVVVTMESGADAQAQVDAFAERGVEAEAREMVTLAFPVTLRVDVERAGVGDDALTSTLLARALLRATDCALQESLDAAPPPREEPKIVVPRLVPPHMGSGRRG